MKLQKIFSFIIITNIIFSQHTIEAGMFYYDPPSIEIEIGDTIEWINVEGVHDVNGVINSITDEPFNNPEDFYLGINNGGSLGTVVFNIPGEYNYDCSVGSHALQGMIGSITVIESNPCESGYSLYENYPDNVNVLDGSNCFYDADLEVLNDLIESNNLDFTSPFEIGKQTWTENRLRIFIAGNYYNGGFLTLNTLPNSFGNLTDLAMLYLNWNNLTSLPESMDQLTNLIYLVLSNNYLTSIFNNIGNLENLILLDLGYNELESIPESIGNLQNLTYLYLFINQLTSLPESICNLNVNWDGLDNAFIPYFGSGGNQLCDDVPDCIENSENFNTSLEQYYYSFAIEVPQDCGSLGDVNGDDSIDVLDIVFTVGIILNSIDYTDNQYQYADLNGDGGVDVIDIVLIIDMILNP
tara:strand:+ start:181 stop:1413 length:1233 start_codon:yes stop_codon:yes gene_type:complete